MIKETTYYVINLEEVSINKSHPYTLIFKGYVPTYGGNKLYTFEYNGDIDTDCSMPDKVEADFKEQLRTDYGFGIIFDINDVRRKLRMKNQYRMEM